MTSHSMIAISPKSRRKRKRDFIVTKNVSDGAEVSLREPTGSSRKNVRDGEERAGAKREEKVGSLRSAPQKHPGCTTRK
jgi:hypothetical protein